MRYAIARDGDDGPPLLLLLLSTAAKNAASNRHSQEPEHRRRRFLHLDHDLPSNSRPLRYLHSSDWKLTSADAKESIVQTGSGDAHWPGSSAASRCVG